MNILRNKSSVIPSWLSLLLILHEKKYYLSPLVTPHHDFGVCTDVSLTLSLCAYSELGKRCGNYMWNTPNLDYLNNYL